MTAPIASSSVLPAAQAPWPGKLRVPDPKVVFPLGFQVRGPPFMSISDSMPEADKFCSLRGLHFAMVKVPLAVPDEDRRGAAGCRIYRPDGTRFARRGRDPTLVRTRTESHRRRSEL